MTEGDYGVQLPFPVHGVQLDAGDSVKFTFKEEKNGEALFEKVYTDEQISGNIVDLSLTKAESDLLEAGKTYIYTMDWYRNDVFQYCLIDDGTLKVVDKP